MQPTDPLYAQQWHLTAMGNLQKIWDEYSGAGVSVGLYDEGVNAAHPDIAANYDASRQVNLGGVIQSGEPGTDQGAHGMPIAGIISAVANNGQGGVGIAWGSSVTSVNVFDDLTDMNALDGTPFLEVLHQMTNFDIVNNSWGPSYFFTDYAGLQHVDSRFRLVELEYDYAAWNGRNGLGTIITQGVGNLNEDAQGAGTTTSRYSISVGGFGPDGFVSDYANFGSTLLISAPTSPGLIFADGEGILSTDLLGAEGYNDSGTLDDYVANFGGTSAAGPMVAGVVALMLDANEGLGWRDVQNILAASATHTGTAFGGVRHANENDDWFFNESTTWNGGGMHFSDDYGYGAVDAFAAVRMAEVWSLFQPAQTSYNENIWQNWKWGADIVDFGTPIADGATLTEALNLAPSQFGLRVEHIDVIIAFQHDDFQDLRIFLVSPEGTEVQLYYGVSDDLDPDDLSAAFDNTTWTFGVDSLRGEYLTGDWTLRIEDSQGDLDEGQLFWWQVYGYGEAAFAPNNRSDTYTYTDEFLAMLALEPARAILADAGGTDWINAAAVTGDMAINLNEGVANTVDGISWFTIAAGTFIEHAVTGDGDDTLIGSSFGNRLYGMRGNDILDGRGGGDTLDGGTGNDVCLIASPADYSGDRINGGAGTDRIRFTSIAAGQITLSSSVWLVEIVEIANAAGSSAGLTALSLNCAAVTAGLQIVGNNGVNALTGTALADTLDGRGGTDTLKGGNGSDTYLVDFGLDLVVEGASAGTDLVRFTGIGGQFFTLGLDVENLTLDGGAATSGTGNAGANTITGNGAGNILNGGGGADTLIGGNGNDTYVVDLTDVVAEAAGAAAGAADTIQWAGLINQTYMLKTNVEHLTLTGAAATRGTGNSLANTITGNNAANILNGGGGNDTLLGGVGKDTLTGGLNNDIFLYTASNQSAVGALADVITDFDRAGMGDDRINLSALFGPALVYRHNGAFTAAGQVRINDIAGPNVIVEVNLTGAGGAEMQIRLTNTTLASMAATDFML